MKILTVSEKEAGQRLDKYLLRYLNQAPKSFIYKMLRKKNIVLNKKKADGSEHIQPNDSIQLFLSDETLSKFTQQLVVEKQIPLDIIYEDTDVLFINKPAGQLSQKAVDTDVSMNEYIISYLISSGSITTEELKTFHPAICNRLDRNTSGILLAGKTMAGLQQLSQMLKERTVSKYYLCVVAGVLTKPQHIQGYLLKDNKQNKVRVCQQPDGEGDEIQTAYQPLCNNGSCTLLKVELITGRTHQIRSHLASIGHPIAGDWKYGSKTFNQKFEEKYGLKSQLLHAYLLSFNLSVGALKMLSGQTYRAEIPELFASILKAEHLEDV